MTEQRAPKGNEWADVVEVLHGVVNMMTVRTHYYEGHPAIAQADELAGAGLTRILGKISELVVALIDGEFVICERPLPELRSRLHVLAEAMLRHDIECIVFQHGISPEETTFFGKALAIPADKEGKIREYAQQGLTHILLRFAALKEKDALGAKITDAAYLVPYVQEMLVDLARSLTAEEPIERLTLMAAAQQIVGYCKRRSFTLVPRCYTRSFYDEATHATNVAMMTAAMALEAGYNDRVCIDVTAGALVHDIGHVLLPEAIRGMPEPVLDPQAVPIFRNHTFAGAQALMLAGCPPLWVAAALEHHRGVDGEGYPKTSSKEPPHELVRMIALANFFDRRRTLLEGRIDQPDMALQRAMALEDRYFGKPLLRRFLRALGVYPPGTTVELSNRQPAMVTAASGDPWRPQVRILRGMRSGRRIDLKDMNALEGRHELSIVRSILPPLLVLDDAILPDVADDDPDQDPAIAAAAARIPRIGPSSNEVARSELRHMDNLIDALDDISLSPLLNRSAPLPPRASIPAPEEIGLPPQGRIAPPPPRLSIPEPEEVALPPRTRAPSTAPPPQQRPSSPGVYRSVQEPSPRPQRMPTPAPFVPAPVARLTRSSVPRLAVPATELERFSLDPIPAYILRFVDGAASAGQIVAASRQPENVVAGVLDDLLRRGVIAID